MRSLNSNGAEFGLPGIPGQSENPSAPGCWHRNRSENPCQPEKGNTATNGLYVVAIRDTLTPMIKSFRHKGLQRFFETGSKAGIQAAHADKLRLQLAALDQAIQPEDLSAPSWGLHPLKGDLKGHWAITVNGNWRMVFAFEGTDAVLVDYRDYH